MSNYGKIEGTFWTGNTGRQIVSAGQEAVIVSVYLMSSPHANMLGLYYLPIVYLCHDTGLTEEGALKGLARASEAGFCEYDRASSWVWIRNMAFWRVERTLKPEDNRVKKVASAYAELPNNPFLGDFFDHYTADFHLQDRRENKGPPKGLRSPSEANNNNRSNSSSSSSTPSSSLRSEDVVSPPPARAREDSPPVITIPLVGDAEFPITAEQVDEWGRLFPAVDVPQQLRAIRAWNLANPKNRKTKAGVLRHVTTWLAKEQDRGPTKRNDPHGQRSSAASRAVEAERRILD